MAKNKNKKTHINLAQDIGETTNDKELRDVSDILKGVNIETLSESQREDLNEFINELVIQRCRKSFYAFVQVFAPLHIPGSNFVYGKHIEMICNDLQEVFESIEDPNTPTKRSQYFLPPRAMKSVLNSILFPAWVLGMRPDYSIISVGNSTKFAEDNFGRNVRSIMQRDEYKIVFPGTVLKKDAKSAGRFVTTEGGVYYTTGVGSSIAGRGAHITICDDVVSEQTAYSKVERTKINEWYLGGLRSRLFPTPVGAEIIVNTRWHMEDLSAYLIKVDEDTDRPWNIFSVPAVLDGKACEMLNSFKSRDSRGQDLKFEEGDSFWPQFQPLQGLLERKAAFLRTEPHKWNALYLQNPIPQEGGIIKFSEWQDWNKKDENGLLKPPQIKQVIVSMDTAFSTTEAADNSAITVWGVFNQSNGITGQSIPCLILLWAEKGKWDFPTLCEKARGIYTDDRWPRPDMFIIEKKASGQSLIQVLEGQLPLWPYTPDKDKRSRLFACSPYFKQGKIFAPSSKNFAQEVIDEVCNFPSAPHDDLADTVSQAILFFKENEEIYLDEDGFAYDMYDDEWENEHNGSKPNKTYWSALA